MNDERGLAADANLRPVTQTLIYAMVLDVWPGGAVIVDFGLVSAEHYEAVFYAFRHGDVTKADLDAALGNGPKLTELMRNAPHNPHRDKNLVFSTPWDGLDPKGRDRLSRSEIKLRGTAKARAKRLGREIEEERLAGRDVQPER